MTVRIPPKCHQLRLWPTICRQVARGIFTICCSDSMPLVHCWRRMVCVLRRPCRIHIPKREKLFLQEDILRGNLQRKIFRKSLGFRSNSILEEYGIRTKTERNLRKPLQKHVGKVLSICNEEDCIYLYGMVGHIDRLFERRRTGNQGLQFFTLARRAGHQRCPGIHGDRGRRLSIGTERTPWW